MKRSNAMYFATGSTTYKRTGDTQEEEQNDSPDNGYMLCNFAAWITKETRYIDGMNHETLFTINGEHTGEALPEITVKSEKFNSLSWVMDEWGVRCVIRAGSGTKDELRTAIQMFSTDVRQEVVYRHTGWVESERESQRMYLTATGAITAKGKDDHARVELPQELQNYAIDMPETEEQEHDAFDAALSLLDIAPIRATAVCLAATVRACIAPADFGLHITGRSGTFKSELSSIFQSFYGERMDARNLPASWSSTANALEAIAYRAKNAILVIDDFIPVGTSWQVRQYNKTADQIVRGQGNQAGRARLTDTSTLQATMYPRGLIFSTGEDTPEGLSLRGRLMIMELERGDVKSERLSEAQSKRGIYNKFLGSFIQWVCVNTESVMSTLEGCREYVRDQNLEVGHSRTPQMIGDLAATFAIIGAYATDKGFYTQDKADELYERTLEAIRQCALTQTSYLTEADPATQFVNSLQAVLAGKAGHLANMFGGTPEHCESFGWKDTGRNADFPTYKGEGTKIGWVDITDEIVYLNAETAYDVIKRSSNGNVSVTKNTLWKRLKEAGMLDRVDEARQRNTVRVTVEKTVKHCVAMRLSTIFEKPQEDQELEY